MDNKVYIEDKIRLVPYDYEDEYKHHKLTVLKHQSSRLKKKIHEINDNLEDFSRIRE